MLSCYTTLITSIRRHNVDPAAEVEEELKREEEENDTDGIALLETGQRPSLPSNRGYWSALSNHAALFSRELTSPIFMQCFTMTFLAEWGDRSQIATIALAAAKDPIGVIAGAIFGHACCTGVAVLGGRLFAARISERMILFVGGLLFLVFALHSGYNGFQPT